MSRIIIQVGNDHPRVPFHVLNFAEPPNVIRCLPTPSTHSFQGTVIYNKGTWSYPLRVANQADVRFTKEGPRNLAVVLLISPSQEVQPLSRNWLNLQPAPSPTSALKRNFENSSEGSSCTIFADEGAIRQNALACTHPRSVPVKGN